MSIKTLEEEILETGMYRLAACFDTISTNVKGEEGRTKLRNLADIIREDTALKSLQEVNDELGTLFSIEDLTSESTCIHAALKELIGTFALVSISEIVDQVSTLEDALLDYRMPEGEENE